MKLFNEIASCYLIRFFIIYSIVLLVLVSRRCRA